MTASPAPTDGPKYPNVRAVVPKKASTGTEVVQAVVGDMGFGGVPFEERQAFIDTAKFLKYADAMAEARKLVTVVVL